MSFSEDFPNKSFELLIIEDDKNLAYLVQKKLKRVGYETHIAYTGKDAITLITEKTKPALILLDYRLVDMSGKEFIELLNKTGLNIPFLIMTGFGDEKIAVEMMKLGAVDYLVKDQNFLEILLPVIQKVQENIELGRKLTDTQETLKKSEIRFRTLIENSTDITMIFDSQGFITYLSPSIYSSLGYRVEDLLGKNFFSIIHHDDKVFVESKFKNILTTSSKIDNFSFKVKNNRGSFCFLEGTFNNLLNEPTIQGILTNLRDITIRTEAENKIRKLSLGVDQSPASIIITDKRGLIEYVNPKFCKTSGYEASEILGKSPNFLKSGRHSDDFYKDLWTTILSGKEWRGELQNKNKNGSLYWESISISPITDKDDNISHFIAIKEDITEKKINEDKLRRANEFYITLFEDSPTMIWRSNKEGNKDYFNKTWLRFRGQRSEEEKQGDWLTAIHQDDRDFYLRSFKNSLLTKEPTRITYRLLRYNNEYRWITEICKPYYDIDGYFAGLIGTCIDITENKLAEDNMRRAKEEAEKSEALKTEFLAQMSHEIRTPINAILSFTSLLKYELEDKVDDDLRESFRIIDKGGRRLIRTIDLLLHMSEIQTGNYQIVNKEINLQRDVIDNIILELMNFASLKNIEISINSNIDDDKILVDEHSAMQIFENIIDNAIKYNKDYGKIVINIYGNDNSVITEIEDTGIGISESFLPHIFAPFTQEESGYTRKFEGNGLGLALVKKYCEINNASIEVRSQKGKGSTFTITLPRSC